MFKSDKWLYVIVAILGICIGAVPDIIELIKNINIPVLETLVKTIGVWWYFIAGVFVGMSLVCGLGFWYMLYGEQ